MRLLSTAVPALALALSASCGGSDCRGIDSPLTSSLFIDGCTSPVGFCSRGTVASGTLAGTFEFTASTSAQPDPSTPVMFYTGAVIYTTSDGTLTVTDSGTFDASNGAFIETQQVTGGTQGFGRSAGTLTSQGQGIFAQINGATQLVGFNGSVAGQVCPTYAFPGTADTSIDGPGRFFDHLDEAPLSFPRQLR